MSADLPEWDVQFYNRQTKWLAESVTVKAVNEREAERIAKDKLPDAYRTNLFRAAVVPVMEIEK